MQTHCPHCDTRFRVTEEQINTADGYVRCGVCKEVFNAFEVASQDENQPSLLKTESIETNQDALSDETAKNAGIETQAAAVASGDFQSTDDEPINYGETSAVDDAGKDTFDFFDETVNESLPHVVPDQFRETHSFRSKSAVSTILWSFASLFLATTLCIEYIWFNRDQFNDITAFKTIIDRACKQFKCQSISFRDASKMELITRNVYSHPNEKDALIVDVTMKNNAEFAQPYPVLQIDFSDIRGNMVAARRFLPSDYLFIDETQQRRLLAPDASASVTLEIQDPGKQAMTYEFEFL